MDYCWGNNGALRAFGKGFVLRSAFRGKPIGSFRPRFTADQPLGEGGAWDDVQKTEFSAAKDWCIRLWVTFAAPVDAFARRLGFGDVHIWLVSRRMLSRWDES